MVGKVGRGGRTVERPEPCAGRVKAHPAFVEYTEAVVRALRALDAFRPRAEIARPRGSGGARGCPPAPLRQIDFLETDLGPFFAADLLIPYVRDSEEGHHVVTVWEFPPKDRVSVT